MRPQRYLARPGPGHVPPVGRTWLAALPRHDFGSHTPIKEAASLATLAPLGRIDAGALSLALLLIGRLIETSASFIVLAPILAPVAMHFGVNLIAACAVARIPLEQVVIRLIPFVLVIFGCLMVITYFRTISIGLCDLVYAR